MADLDELIGTSDAARELGIGPTAIRDAVHRGTIAVIRKGDRNYITRAELERYRLENAGRFGRKPKQQQ